MADFADFQHAFLIVIVQPVQWMLTFEMVITLFIAVDVAIFIGIRRIRSGWRPF